MTDNSNLFELLSRKQGGVATCRDNGVGKMDGTGKIVGIDGNDISPSTILDDVHFLIV